MQEVIVSREEAAKIMADDSLLILRIEKLPWKWEIKALEKSAFFFADRPKIIDTNCFLCSGLQIDTNCSFGWKDSEDSEDSKSAATRLRFFPLLRSSAVHCFPFIRMIASKRMIAWERMIVLLRRKIIGAVQHITEWVAERGCRAECGSGWEDYRMAKLAKITKLMKLKVGKGGCPPWPCTTDMGHNYLFPKNQNPEKPNPPICLFQG